jgi:ADP-ribosylation factor-like protein 1
VFLIDSCDKTAHFTSRDELQKLFSSKEIEKAVFLVLANKQDMKEAMTVEQIIHLFGLQNLEANTWSIYGISAINGTGIEPAFDWLIDNLNKG